MKIQEKPDYLIFADSAKNGECANFPDVSRGWGVTIDQTASKPPMEWMNGAFNRIDKNMLYLLQQGIPEWSEKVIYPANAIIKYNGVLYIAIVENDEAKPSTNTTKWKKIQADYFNALPAVKTTANGESVYEVNDLLQLLNEVDFNILPTLKKQNMIGNGVLSKNGYAQIPLFIAGKIQNIVIQWGEGNTDATGRARVTLPISNPNATLFAIAVERDAQAWFSSNSATTWGISAKDSTKSQITICTKGITSGQIVIGSYAYSYLTIGY